VAPRTSWMRSGSAATAAGATPTYSASAATRTSGRRNVTETPEGTTSAPANCCTAWVSTTSPAPTPTGSRAGGSSGWRSRGRRPCAAVAAARRDHLGAGPGAGGRGARDRPGAGPRWHHDPHGHARDGVREAGVGPGLLPRRGEDPGAGPARPGAGAPAEERTQQFLARVVAAGRLS